VLPQDDEKVQKIALREIISDEKAFVGKIHLQF